MHNFHKLGPDRVMDLVERVMDVRVEPVCRPLTSYINRVYEVLLENGEAVVIKFYRPGRWSLEALDEEHEFVFDLKDADVPVVAPLLDQHGDSLFEESENLWCAIYPRRRGRPFEDLDDAGWQELGRTLARVHLAGDECVPENRMIWHPEEASQVHLDFILDHVESDPDFCDRYEDAAGELLDAISPLFDESIYTRIHGDMHSANLMRRPGTQGIFLIDFDDMAFGPPVQDLWMLLPDVVDNSQRELQHLLHGYHQLREFDYESLRWVEPLRAMRFIHFSAWCAQQQADSARQRDPEFGNAAWWNRELASLCDQRERIRDTLGI
ncbi:serine/threonine protein kinase [Kiritimatiellaeota bacterium B1221]|nr:serine/threonine protein kinase [Kiritimatiellaeota bacterium B1221]